MQSVRVKKPVNQQTKHEFIFDSRVILRRVYGSCTCRTVQVAFSRVCKFQHQAGIERNCWSLWWDLNMSTDRGEIKMLPDLNWERALHENKTTRSQNQTTLRETWICVCFCVSSPLAEPNKLVWRPFFGFSGLLVFVQSCPADATATDWRSWPTRGVETKETRPTSVRKHCKTLRGSSGSHDNLLRSSKCLKRTRLPVKVSLHTPNTGSEAAFYSSWIKVVSSSFFL